MGRLNLWRYGETIVSLRSGFSVYSPGIVRSFFRSHARVRTESGPIPRQSRGKGERTFFLSLVGRIL